MKGWLLNRLEGRGYVLLNQKKIARRNTWMRDLGVRSVLDVGANVGESAMELHAILPDAAVYSFEPLADSFAKMEAGLKGQPWWKGFNVAASAEAGEAVIHRSSYALSSSLLPMGQAHKDNYPYTAGASQETIITVRLDDVVREHGITGPILLKLDVQGFEVPALQGATQTLSNAAAVICETSFVELYEGQRLFADVSALLTGQGFVYAGSAGQRNSPLNGRPLQQDAIFLRP